jgi:hypothetical protein
MQRATVHVICEESAGSGFAVGAPSLIITNAHVVEGCGEILIRDMDGNTQPASVLERDPLRDLALLRTPERLNVGVPSLRNDQSVQIGEMVWALGFPGIAEVSDSPLARATSGPVGREAIEDESGERFILDHSAGIYPGNSGGPLFDGCGKVVGVNTAIAEQDGQLFGGVGIAIGSRSVADFIRRHVPPGSLMFEECRLSAVDFVDALMAAAIGGGPDAKAIADRLAELQGRFPKQFQREWDARSGRILLSDSTLAGLPGLISTLQTDLNRRITGLEKDQIKRLDDITSRIDSLDMAYGRRQRLLTYALIGLIVVVTSLAIAGWRIQTREKRRVSAVEVKVDQVGARLEQVESDLRERISEALRGLERQNPAVARDVSGAVDLLRSVPGYTVESMTARVRTIVEASRGGSFGQVADAPTGWVRTVHPVAEAMDVEIIVRDGAGQRTVHLPAGMVAQIGRDSDALSVLAGGFVVPALRIPIVSREQDTQVSRCHVAVRNDGGRLLITDLSLNGTFILSPAHVEIVRGAGMNDDPSRRNRDGLLERGDSAEVASLPVVLALSRPNSGYEIELRRHSAVERAAALN